MASNIFIENDNLSFVHKLFLFSLPNSDSEALE